MGRIRWKVETEVDCDEACNLPDPRTRNGGCPLAGHIDSAITLGPNYTDTISNAR